MSTRRSFLQAIGMSAAGVFVPERFARAGAQQMLLAFSSTGPFLGTWSNGAAFPGPHGLGLDSLSGCGVKTAALSGGGIDSGQSPVVTAAAYTFNGSAWSSVANLASQRYNARMVGTTSAAVSFGGNDISGDAPSSVTEGWNGSAWSSGGALGVVRGNGTGYAGTSTAALCASGWSGSANITTSEKYNGSTWSSAGTVNTARRGAGGAGTATDAIWFGGYSTTYSAVTETYNGSAWSSGTSLNAAAYYVSGAGASGSAALRIGGNNGSDVTTTETYNSGVWTTSNGLNTARNAAGGAGTNSSAVAWGGGGGTASTELYG